MIYEDCLCCWFNRTFCGDVLSIQITKWNELKSLSMIVFNNNTILNISKSYRYHINKYNHIYIQLCKTTYPCSLGRSKTRLDKNNYNHNKIWNVLSTASSAFWAHMNGTKRNTFSNERLVCFWKVYINKKSKKTMSQPHQQTNGFSFQSSLKSQDDSSIKYEAFNDEDYNKEAHNIEKVILVIIVNISNIYKCWFLLIHVMEKISKILCL